MTTEQLVVLDYSTGTVNFYNIDKKAKIDDEYISSLGFSLSECYWMTGNIDVINHTRILK